MGFLKKLEVASETELTRWVNDDIKPIVLKCSSKESILSEAGKRKLMEHLITPILRFHMPYALGNLNTNGSYYNSSLFQGPLDRDILEKIEKLYNKMKI